MIVTQSREWREKTNSCSHATPHRSQPHRFSTQGWKSSLYYVDEETRLCKAITQGVGVEVSLNPGSQASVFTVSLWHPHFWQMSLADEGEGAFACLLLHLCVLTKVLDIKGEIKSGKWQSKWKKLKYFKAIFSFKNVLANSILLEKNSGSSS